MWVSLVHHTSPTDISKLLNVCSRTDARYVDLFNSTGDVVPRARSNGPHRLLGQYEQMVLLRLIVEVSGIYVSVIQEELHDRFGLKWALLLFAELWNPWGAADKGYNTSHYSALMSVELGSWLKLQCMTHPYLSGLMRLDVTSTTVWEGTGIL